MLLVFRKKHSQYNRRIYAEYFVDYLFILRTQLEYDVMFSRTFYDKIRTE